MTASALPELWRTFTPRPPRPPIDWRSIRVSILLTLAAGALVWTGATSIGVGELRLGLGMMAVGVVALVLAAQERW